MLKFTLVSLDPIKKCGWTFKVSGSDYDGCILVFAIYDRLCYSRVKYFSNNESAREWIDSLVSYTREIFENNLE